MILNFFALVQLKKSFIDEGGGKLSFDSARSNVMTLK